MVNVVKAMMSFQRNPIRRAFRPALFPCLTVAAALALGVPTPVQAQLTTPQVQQALKSASTSREIRDFYRARGNAPLWIRGASLRPEANQLLRLLETAHLDGLNYKRYKTKSLRSAMEKASAGSPRHLARAEMQLSQQFAAYVQDLRRLKPAAMHLAEAGLAPTVPTQTQVLQAAASSRSLSDYLASSGWMHPVYGQLRSALAATPWESRQAQLLRVNLDRARALPAYGRHVLVDSAGARLWMYENGEVVDSMKVVVGQDSKQTPVMAGRLRYATVQPYWNVPPDLVQERIAPNVLDQGFSYLKSKGYEVLSDWSEEANVTDPKLVDWKAVAAGRRTVRVRQKPGSDNAMGKVKFMFPNDLGIYLHDTPDRQLFREDARQFSAGCVRVEDSARFAKWLFGKPLDTRSKTPEKQVQLPTPVPVYISYFTAFPEKKGIAFRSDPYRLDALALAPQSRLASR